MGVERHRKYKHGATDRSIGRIIRNRQVATRAEEELREFRQAGEPSSAFYPPHKEVVIYLADKLPRSNTKS